MSNEAGSLFPPGVIFYPEAPKRIIEEHGHDSSYYAYVTKRLGGITPAEYANIATKFIRLCNETYRTSTFEIYSPNILPAKTPLGRMASEHEAQLWPDDIPDPLGPTQLSSIYTDPEYFPKLFQKTLADKNNHGFRFVIRPDDEAIRPSFAAIDWWRAHPNTMWFYAQGRSLVQSLYRHMFYVPDAPPNVKFSVGLGISAYLNKEDKVFRR